MNREAAGVQSNCNIYNKTRQKKTDKIKHSIMKRRQYETMTKWNRKKYNRLNMEHSFNEPHTKYNILTQKSLKPEIHCQ